MMVNQNPNAGLVGVIVVLLIAGLMMGLTVSNTDLVNFNRSAAEARAMDLETQTAAQIAEIDIAYHRAVRAAEQEELWLGVAATQHELEQSIRLAELSHYVWLGVGSVSVLCVSVGLATFLVLHGRSRLAIAQTPPSPVAGTWQDPVWREEQIRIARERARAERQGRPLPTTVPNTHNNGNGHH